MLKRAELRQRYDIHGSAASDCCTSYCCLCCALVQQDREVALRAGSHGPVTQGYQGQQEMQVPGGQQGLQLPVQTGGQSGPGATRAQVPDL